MHCQQQVQAQVEGIHLSAVCCQAGGTDCIALCILKLTRLLELNKLMVKHRLKRNPTQRNATQRNAI